MGSRASDLERRLIYCVLGLGSEESPPTPGPSSWTQVRPKGLSCGELGLLVKAGFLPSSPRRAVSNSNEQSEPLF